MSQLNGAVALVTGGARGIGRAICEALEARGAKVAWCDLDPAGQAGGHLLDVRDRAAFLAWIQEVEARWGPVDLLVNNAGIMPVGPFLSHTEAADRLMVDVNIHGVLNGIHAVLPGMLARKSGHIVNVSSIVGRMPMPFVSTYAGTKFAVVGLTESLIHEHWNSGVNFTIVHPGSVDTELVAGLPEPTWPKHVTPQQVAAATCRAIARNKRRVFVPAVGALFALLPWLIPDGIGRWLAKVFGALDLMKRVDEEGRDGYRQRVLPPAGAVEDGGESSD